MTATFEARYQANDGYCGKQRPKYFKIDASELEDDMDEEGLIEFYEQEVENHFQEHVHPDAERVDEFVAWAREQLAARAVEDENTSSENV